MKLKLTEVPDYGFISKTLYWARKAASNANTDTGASTIEIKAHASLFCKKYFLIRENHYTFYAFTHFK